LVGQFLHVPNRSLGFIALKTSPQTWTWARVAPDGSLHMELRAGHSAH
jgi:hypothetical protein